MVHWKWKLTTHKNENEIKYLEIKQITTEQQMGYRENKGEIKSFLETNENEDKL